MTSLREQFEQTEKKVQTDARAPLIAAANQFLNDLADNFKKSVNEKVDEAVATKGSFPGSVSFENDALNNVTPTEVRGTDGWARLNEICAGENVDTGLSLNSDFGPRLVQFSCIKIYTTKGYSEVGEGLQKKLAAPKKRGIVSQLIR